MDVELASESGVLSEFTEGGLEEGAALLCVFEVDGRILFLLRFRRIEEIAVGWWLSDGRWLNNRRFWLWYLRLIVTRELKRIFEA